MFGNGVFLATHFMDHIQSLSKFFKATADLSIIIFLFSVKASKTFSWGQRPSYHQMWRMFDEYVFSYDSANSIDNYRDQSNRDWPFVSPIIHLADKPAYSYLKYVYVFDGFCTPFLNNQLCGWDGGDCCYPYVDTHQRCGLGEDCTCHWTGLRHPTYKDGNASILKRT